MKKITFIFCFFALGSVAYSQSYYKLIRAKTYWDVFDITNPAICYSYANRIYFTGEDTIIDGRSYKISKEYSFQAMNPGPFCPPFVIQNTADPTNQFLREDTIARKVYIYCFDCTPPMDDLFYDFNLQVGDTLKSWWAGYGWPTPLICTSIQNIVLQNGEIRKQFNISDGYPTTLSYIESIGGQNGLFEPLISAIGSSGGYFCQSENGTNLWGIDCNNYFVGVNQEIPNKYLVLPNPAHDFVNIILTPSSEIFEFILSNIQSKIVLRKILLNERSKIPLSGLIPGVYYYNLKSKDHNVNGKLIIF